MSKTQTILSLILLSFFFLEIVYSSSFNIVTDKKEFKPSTELYGVFSQRENDLELGGYHKAEIYFKTTVPSINPDQSGVKSVDCGDGNKITLNLDDENAIKNVNNWTNTVMLMVSHKWDCFKKNETQFFLTKNKSIDIPNKKVTFTTESCDVSDWAKNFAIDLTWVERKRSSRRNSINKRIPLPTIDKSGTLNLNVLFDETTGKSSKPNLSLFSNSDISVLCTDCFMKGEATISAKFAGSFSLSGVKLDEATVSLSGSALMNLDLLVNGTIASTFNFDTELISVPLPGFPGIPGIFSLGPSIDLVVASKVAANITGSLSFGGDVGLPSFNANASFVDITKPTFIQSGFVPESNLHKPKFGISSASVDINGSIKPQLAFGVDVLKGKFEKKVGFQIVGSLDNNISFGNKAACTRKTQPRLKTDINGNLGFFVNEKGFPVVNFPTINLIDKCL
ncbi:hypothetical protein RhiirA1_541970 [Rhizophagus irregularis]|uniref:Apple protein n=1 Tax=Rhizophagus irregularis TaxID=588596 RepID=A0A2I1EBC3_9GLOM|nr:hypothetical protein RhiirA1_541970 [Rhizophagus irregularis]PKY19436.1 hypothetical protein RhiirB3_469164 [Rhizophagus irregularis]CAB4482292.1 unnamed protein product [Rhizophagus irregularis]CAB5353502.1 unnamed protein product [Rhizophagus irregularis]